MISTGDLERADFLEFETDHLLSKWGFQDGEMLDEPLRVLGFEHLACDEDLWYQFIRRTLCEVVERSICTEIKTPIKPYRVVTNHNPIRIYEVDGTNTADSVELPKLSPLSIKVPLSFIRAVAAEVETSIADQSGNPTSYMVKTQKANEIASLNGWE